MRRYGSRFDDSGICLEHRIEPLVETPESTLDKPKRLPHRLRLPPHHLPDGLNLLLTAELRIVDPLKMIMWW